MIKSARSQVALLALCHALAMATNTVLITTVALIDYTLATDKVLATLPLAVRQLATMVVTVNNSPDSFSNETTRLPGQLL